MQGLQRVDSRGSVWVGVPRALLEHIKVTFGERWRIRGRDRARATPDSSVELLSFARVAVAEDGLHEDLAPALGGGKASMEDAAPASEGTEAGSEGGTDPEELESLLVEEASDDTTVYETTVDETVVEEALDDTTVEASDDTRVEEASDDTTGETSEEPRSFVQSRDDL